MNNSNEVERQPELADQAQAFSFGYGLMVAVFCSMGAGMGWGIRGQYGHETGAMIAGLLASSVLALGYLRGASSLRVARAIAIATMGVGLGGSMTYGQTVGLTHDGELVGHAGAYWWGMLGLFIKGGVWIGIMGLMLGMAFSRHRYRVREIALLLPILLLVMVIGTWIFNRPFDPAGRSLPRLYFSDHWFWEPDKVDMKPRLECWGGLVAIWAALTYYVYAFRGDLLARNMAWVGYLAGGIGFAGGQSIQAFHAWYPDLFTSDSKIPLLASLDWLWPHVNWWNTMETTFGLIFGLILGIGLWCNQRLIATEKDGEADAPWSFGVEYILFFVHVTLLVVSEFFDNNLFAIYTEYGLILVAIPWITSLNGRVFPYAFSVLVVAAPIAGKTLRNISIEAGDIPIEYGVILFVFVPLAITVYLTARWARAGLRGASQQASESKPSAQSGVGYAARLLLFATWFYFSINFAFFRMPWPWKDWTGRTPHALVFAFCAVGLTIAAFSLGNLRITGQQDEQRPAI